jgi:hypothetical protein
MSKHYLRAKHIVALLAHWGIRQSPFNRPENLTEAVDAAYVWLLGELPQLYPGAVDDWYIIEEEGLKALVGRLVQIPEVAAWNVPKVDKGRKYVFVTSCSSPKPEYDFIDSDALSHNILRALEKERENVLTDDSQK